METVGVPEEIRVPEEDEAPFLPEPAPPDPVLPQPAEPARRSQSRPA